MADVGVRPARRADAAAVADVQVRAWRHGYRDLLPADVLAEVTAPAALEVWRDRWADAATAPPSPRHRLLVAVASDLVVGFAAHGPAEDPDLDPERTAELITLLVDPAHARAGHGSRLLAATADLLREDGFVTLITWVFEDDEVTRTFLGSAGWAPDGTSRTLDMGEPVRQIRLHTDISG
ncbi:acetyltransferase (GNAT) family protein [Actinomadura pelletieri DSM 43383]|uniref:Acetyltransferase (GNAT) family protein n=1 Tax=Actinomadura pelletieri DSM 43383 TaxID=1120940 RepID=A0A495QPR0_9ACTN|nr:GNAT family N-acetyltransferase [Actinomadura pelletieri]RKS74909.1 acetyltransferase (GNAT) family protein [Actinomadura pelletieri DSM 43383]